MYALGWATGVPRYLVKHFLGVSVRVCPDKSNVGTGTLNTADSPPQYGGSPKSNGGLNRTKNSEQFLS